MKSLINSGFWSVLGFIESQLQMVFSYVGKYNSWLFWNQLLKALSQCQIRHLKMVTTLLQRQHMSPVWLNTVAALEGRTNQR